MPFHREYPVRTYQSLVKDLQAPESRPHRRHVAPREREAPKGQDDVWTATYKALMRYTLDEIRDMAEREGVDMKTVIRKDSKGQLVNAIIRVRKERLGAK